MLKAKSMLTQNVFAATLNSSTFHQKLHLNIVSYSVSTLKDLKSSLPASPYPPQTL